MSKSEWLKLMCTEAGVTLIMCVLFPVNIFIEGLKFTLKKKLRKSELFLELLL